MTSAFPDSGGGPIDRASSANRAIFLLGLVAFLGCSLFTLNESFWLDELITAWVVRDGLQDVVTRATTFQGQSPLYFLFAWAAKCILGYHEWSLRLPSLLWNLFTIGFVYEFFRRLKDRDFAACGAGSLALLMAVTRSLCEARPYALAMSCFTLSLLCLVRWARSGKPMEMLCFVCAAMGAFYAHYLFSIGFPLYGVVLVYLRRELRISRGDFAVAASTAMLLGVPALWQLYLLTGKSSLYSFSGPPGLVCWMLNVFRDQSTLALLAGVSLLLFYTRGRGASPLERNQPFLILGLIFWLYPGIAIAVISFISGTPVFVPRYFVYALLGEALVQTGLLCSIASGTQRVMAFLSVGLFALVPYLRSPIFPEDWRTALASISSSAPPASVVLLITGQCEAKDISWFRSSDNRDYLLSPSSYYSVGYPTLPLPYFVSEYSALDIFSEDELSVLSRAEKFFIIGPYYVLPDVAWSKAGTLKKIEWLSSNEIFQVAAVRFEVGMFVIEINRQPFRTDF